MGVHLYQAPTVHQGGVGTLDGATPQESALAAHALHAAQESIATRV